MKTQIPHLNTIADITDRLRVKRGAGFPLQLFVLVPIILLLFWYLFMARLEVLRFYTNFNWEDLVHPFAYIAPVAVLLALSIALKLYIAWANPIPQNFRIQRQSIVPQVLLAGAVTATLLTLTIASAFVIVLMSSTGAEMPFYLLILVVNIFITAFLAAKTKEELEVLRHYIGIYWRHVRVTAVFDKASYKLGGSINVQVRDRMSENSTMPYRVHLNYVEEKIDYTVGSRETDREYRRYPSYNTFLDIAAAELHRGVVLPLPKASVFTGRATALEAKQPRYWEVLVEERGGRYYSRFFVDVRSGA